jgi:protein disulfide-isomerase
MKISPLALLAALLCVCSSPPARAEADWLTDFSKAAAAAKAENKLLLLDFTGSDWCGWCRLMQREIFSQPAFEEYAKKNLVLMTVDFPRAKPITMEVRKQNQMLAEKFEIHSFPTIVVLNGDGKPLAMLGYMPGGPEAFINELKQVPRG